MTPAPVPHLLHVFSTFAAGGPQVRTAQILNALDGAYRHTVVAMDRNFDCAARVRPGIEVHYEEPPFARSSWRAAGHLQRFLKARRPDLVLTYNWGAIESILGARLAGISRLVHAEDGFGPDEVVRQKARRVWARRVLLRAVRRVVVPSLTLQRIAREVWRVPERRCLYLPNGIDTEHYSPGPAAAGRERLGIAAGEFVVGSVATFRREKALPFLIEAFARVRAGRPGKLVLIGDGSELARLRLAAREQGVEADVLFPGHVQDPVDLYRCMDVFALASITEQMPLSVVEAMSVELPVISTAVGDVAGMVCAGNRPFVLPGRDVEAYARSLGELLEDAELRQRLGRENRQKCLAEYRDRTMLEGYATLYAAELARE